MQEYRPVKEGKVYEIYDVGEGLVAVATGYISTSDMVLRNCITDRGAVLTQLSCFWLGYIKDVMPDYMINADITDTPKFFWISEFERYSMLCEKLTMLPIECVVCGYITGSNWESHKKNGTVRGIQLPAGLQKSEQLLGPISTPGTKVETGDHDENTDLAYRVGVLGKTFSGKGRKYAEIIHDKTLVLHRLYASYAETRGTITMDTESEFGLNRAGEAVLADEVLILDSP